MQRIGFGQIMKLEQVLHPELIELLSKKADREYLRINQAEHPLEIAILKMKTGVYNSFSCSFTLDAVLAYDEAIAVLDAILNNPNIAPWVEGYGYVNLDQCWIRRQYPKNENTYKPHGWHQDGSLAFPFLEKNVDLNSGMLDMRILWIPFNNCGDVAPSLEFIDTPINRILPLAELQGDHITQKYPSGNRSYAVLRKGDALLFKGDVLHRTHSTESMHRPRTSLGIRLFKSIPARCKMDRYFYVSQD